MDPHNWSPYILYVRVHICTHIHLYVHAYIYASIHLYTGTHTHTEVYRYIHIYVYMCIYLYTYIYTEREIVRATMEGPTHHISIRNPNPGSTAKQDGNSRNPLPYPHIYLGGSKNSCPLEYPKHDIVLFLSGPPIVCRQKRARECKNSLGLETYV